MSLIIQALVQLLSFLLMLFILKPFIVDGFLLGSLVGTISTGAGIAARKLFEKSNGDQVKPITLKEFKKFLNQTNRQIK